MQLKGTPIIWLKLFGGDTRRAIVAYVIVSLIIAGGGLWVLPKTVLSAAIQISNIQTPLWVTIFLIFLCGLYIYLRTRQRQNPRNLPNIEEELHEAFGVYWNKQNKPRCLYCKYSLKCASKDFDPSIFFCSNCNRKHALRDPSGNHMTEAKAIEELKKFPISYSTDRQNMH